MLNKVTLIGRLGAEPEIRYMPNGDAVATIRLATTRRWMDKNTNERKEETEWHRVVIFGSLAKIAGEYLKKGSLAHFEGRIRTQKWQGQDGQDRFTTEIVANEMIMLDARNGSSAASGENQNTESSQSSNQPPPANYDDFDDLDIPF